MANEKQLKWEGKASAELNGPEAEQVWPLLEDFFGLHKWFPTLTTCLGVEGISGQPGCVRYCAGFKTPVDHKREQDQDQEKVNWTKQKLLSIDPAQLIFSYSIIDGNVGFNSYISTVQVVPKEGGCSVVWKYEVEPVEGWKMEDLDMFIGTGLQVMASRMEASLQLQVGPLEPEKVQVSHAIHSTDDSHRHASNFLPVILSQSFFEMVSLRNSTPTKVRAETELFSILGMLPLSNLLCIVSHPCATLHNKH
ncbi:unnamed protein product [Prunus armeniaca]|uniref:Lachrymatory-factor synthase n=1 Tax=Prunus armeniaca TaxID=36596 RepID=A0A6J5Y2T0_PRUAR|nr:unnamed protein product [Prunus armeniaca]